ncbi:MAG: hypothetical protein KatS3mg032_2506 [Cyclobacteriaceae bacterium]|nr:MAG: hypothetical protein KatS3mg032_2506 [Cyclobacteriaceae bacterium]
MQNQYAIQRMTSTEQLVMGTVQELPLAPPEVLGNDLLNRSFNRATFLLADSAILKDLPARYYIIRNEFEIKTPQSIRILKGDKVKSFVWEDSLTKQIQVFVNMKYYVGEGGIQGSGFMQILSEGKLSLLKHTEVIFKEANYHLALNVGTRDHQFISKTHLYYLSGNTFYRLPRRKNVLLIFPDRHEELRRFVQLNQLNLGNEYHLQALFDYYNNLK